MLSLKPDKGVNNTRRYAIGRLGGVGGVSLASQALGTLAGVLIAFIGGGVVYGVLKATVGLRLDQEEEYQGADLTVHKITATPEREASW